MKHLDVGSRKVANWKFISIIVGFCCPFQNCIVKLPVTILCRWPIFFNSLILKSTLMSLWISFFFVSYLYSTLKLSRVKAIFIRALNCCVFHREQSIFCHLRIWDCTDIITSIMHSNVLVSFAMELDFTCDWTNEFKSEMGILKT